MVKRPARQLALFGGGIPAIPCRRLQLRAKRALGQYAAGAVGPSFALRSLAEEQARLDLLRMAVRRLSRERRNCVGPKRGSKLRLVEYVASPAGARMERAVQACARRIEELETMLLCA